MCGSMEGKRILQSRALFSVWAQAEHLICQNLGFLILKTET